MGVSDRSVKHATRVLSPNSQAASKFRQALEVGSIRVSDASGTVNHYGDVQRQVVAMVLDGRARTAAGAAGSIRGQPAHADEEETPKRILPDATGGGPSCMTPPWVTCTIGCRVAAWMLWSPSHRPETPPHPS